MIKCVHAVRFDVYIHTVYTIVNRVREFLFIFALFIIILVILIENDTIKIP